MKTFSFEAFDTLFFREARPMEAIGARPPVGRFPPQARTVAGAVRGCIGESLGVDWAAYRLGDTAMQTVEAVIGKAKDAGIGTLQLTGPYPTLDGERLYPLPLCWLAKRKEPAANKTDEPSEKPKEKEYEWDRLTLAADQKPVECDLGKVYLATGTQGLRGAKPLEQAWLRRADLARVLVGESPLDIIEADTLFAAEGRLGIDLNSDRRTVVEGLLYQTVHARPQKNVAVGVDVDGLPAGLELKNDIVRLGGEGRFAGFSVRESQTGQALQLNPPKGWNGVLLVLLTPACFVETVADSSCGNSKPQQSRWLPPGFVEGKDPHGAKIWHGTIAGIPLTILSAVIGKAVREGGWDLANHCSRPAVGLIPAGSVFFCTVEGDASLAVQALQGKKIDYETEFGRGELAVGFWEGVQK